MAVLRKTANLFDKDNADVYEHSTLGNANEWSYGGGTTSIVLRIPCDANTRYTLSIGINLGNTLFRISEISTDDVPIEGSSGGYACHTILNGGAINSHTFTTASDTKYILFQVNSNVTTAAINTLMLNKGSTLPYEPYWKEDGYKKYETATDTITSLPQTIIGDGQNISAYTIKGNMTQSGTPTPANPIYPVETGDKTANLFDVGSYSSAILTNCTIAVSNDVLTQTNTGALSWSGWKIDDLQVGTDYTMSVTINNPDKTECQIRIYNSTNSTNIISSSSSKATSITLSVTFTAQTTTHYIRLYSNTSSATANTYSVEFSEIKLNTGSTPLPYEPYGQYKIPISFDSNSYTFYLSEPIRKINDSVDTAPSSGTANRAIVKQRITQASSINQFSRGFTVDIQFAPKNQTIYANIAVGTDEPPAVANRDGKVWINASKEFIGFGATEQFPMSGNNPTQAEIDVFNNYLQNNEVYVWYVLATATTETFTAPTIPTSGTAQSFDVSTTLKPSEVSLTYHGWHEHSDTKYTSG